VYLLAGGRKEKSTKLKAYETPTQNHHCVKIFDTSMTASGSEAGESTTKSGSSTLVSSRMRDEDDPRERGKYTRTRPIIMQSGK